MRYSFTWDRGVSRVDRPKFFRISTVTESDWRTTWDDRTDFWHGMEGGLKIIDELFVGRTRVHGLETINFMSQMYHYLL